MQPLIFVSYSHTDNAEKDQLLTQLRTLQQADIFRVWSDDLVPGGAKWQEEIFEAIEHAKIAVLLITANFLNSDFIIQQEIPRLLEMRERKGLIIFPVIAKDCPWRKVAWLAALNVRPKDGRAIWSPSNPDINKDLRVIAEEIHDRIKRHQTIADELQQVPPSEPRVLFGSLFVEKDNVEKLLTYKDPEDGLETYYFPITEFYDPKTSSIEDAINFALGKLINKLGIDEKEFFEAGIYRPLYYQLYEIKEDRLPKAANPIPYIFFKINLKKEIPLKAKGGWTYYKWAEKTEVVRQWDEPGIFRQHLSLDEITDDALYEKLGENLFKVINSAFVRRELGYKMLECVDMLIFKKPPKESEEEFFMMYRLNLQGWEYPRGRLHYYETRYEGAFRKIKEETGILPSQIKYCGEIGWQTVDVRVRKEYYDTLRVYALVFYVEEPSALSIKLQASSPKYKWMKLDEIRNSLWKAEQDYNVKFFDMWKDSRDEIFQRAGIK